jgi:hypothetical protein
MCNLFEDMDMDNQLLIQVTNRKALRLLHELEELHLIKVLKDTSAPAAGIKLSDKYRGVFSKEDAQSFDEHTHSMRAEWENI